MNAFLSGLFSDHAAAQNALVALRRPITDGARIGVVLRRGAQSRAATGANAPGTHIAGDDAALLAPLGATFVSADGRFLAGGVLADRMRDTTDGNAAQALAALGMPPEEVRQSVRRIEDGEILVFVENIGQESAIRQVLVSAGATNLADAPVRSQIRRNPADMPQTLEPTHAAEGPGTETTSLHHAKAYSGQKVGNEKRRRAAARHEEIATIQADETQANPPAPQP